MSNFSFGLLAVVWFGVGGLIILLIVKCIRSVKEWILFKAESNRALKLNRRRLDLYNRLRNINGRADWEHVCQVIKE